MGGEFARGACEVTQPWRQTLTPALLLPFVEEKKWRSGVLPRFSSN